MKVNILNEEVEVIIERKCNKNTYIRVKSDLCIHVTTNLFATDKYIKDLISNNIESIIKMYLSAKKKLEKSMKFYYLGKEYKVVILSGIRKPIIDENYIYFKSDKEIDKFITSEAKRVLNIRVKEVFNRMDLGIKYPKVNIRKMTRKWGYCNKSDNLITLNKELIKYDIDDIDYVIVHELCHFIEFNHSKNFWDLVKYYKPNFKENKKHLKED